MDESGLQARFFRSIKSIIPPNISLVDEIATLLNISDDSAYRRLRGDKPLTFDEIEILAKKYRISLDQVMDLGTESTVFFGKNVDAVSFDFRNYLTDMLVNLKTFNKANKRMMYYEARDIPIFHHFQYEALANFKYFFWMKSVLYYNEFSRMTYEDCGLPPELFQLGKEITREYNKIPSSEIWVEESITTTLRQIEYYTYSGVIRKKETIDVLYNDVERLIEHIKVQAECGNKFLDGEKPAEQTTNYYLYFNEVYLGHNSIMVETDDVSTAFLNHAVLNYLMTHDPKFCDYTRRSLENNMKKSILISTVAERERNRFFNTLFTAIAKSRKECLAKHV